MIIVRAVKVINNVIPAEGPLGSKTRLEIIEPIVTAIIKSKNVIWEMIFPPIILTRKRARK
jgi:hypothetical protein